MENGKFHNGVIQHLLKFADLQSIVGTSFNEFSIFNEKFMRLSPGKSGSYTR